MRNETAGGGAEAEVSAIDRFVTEHPRLETPYLVMDLDVVAERYRRLRSALPVARVLYAVKANPSALVLRRLNAAGSSFDVASPGEIELCRKCGIAPSRMSYGNTIKKERDIAFAYAAGVRTFTVDAALELDKVIRNAPGSTVYVRLVTDGAGADWPLSRKFGCDPEQALHLLRRASQAGLGVGISFHVGSQQRDPDAWDAPLAEVAQLYQALRGEGIEPAGVNLGGGLPSTYREAVPDVSVYGAAITAALRERLGGAGAGDIFVEPGRYLVGDAGVIETEVVLISERPVGPARQRWVYLDIGMFNGLAETLDEAIRYRIQVPSRRGRPSPAVLAGPTCDSADVLYEKSAYELPEDLRIGDRVRILSAGAYTSSYSSVCFNGFEPLTTYHVAGRSDHNHRRELVLAMPSGGWG
ncbi:MAG TPA: type III PLP-dependent enzyme [Frankiaceae bacterium]|nr:type III PLP-dependent enzyme [Frankiaceae bacterium]